MAAVTVKENSQFDGSKIYNHLVSYLPSYARPRFIRIQVIWFHTHFTTFHFWKKHRVINVYATMAMLDNAACDQKQVMIF